MTTAAHPVRSLSDLAGRRAVVLGLARSGAAAARLLADAGADVTIYDRRSRAELAGAVESLGRRPVRLALAVAPEQATELVTGAELVVTSPSVSARFPTTEPWLRRALSDAEAAGVEVVSEVELFLRLTQARVIGVTGTKGKTTTTALIGSILAAGGVPHAVGGNIGTPLVEQADRLSPRHWAVLELSELQLPTISRGADIAVYTNIGADHVDRHGSVEAYRAVKARLAELTATRGTVVLNADDSGCMELGARVPGAKRWYGYEDRSLQATIAEGQVYVGGRPVLPASEIPLPGRHMHSNVLAAALAAETAGAAAGAIADGIRGFPGVPHRMETAAEVGGVQYVNDSQATIPLATLAALEAFEGRGLVLVAGGRGKGLDYGALAEAIVARCRAAVLIGETAEQLDRLIGGRAPVVRAASMDEAVKRAADLAQPGDVVLLSPAAASFDMFVDYADRGEAFRTAVQALPGAGR
ncbi:MAG TPA: UDP-N-acetylmuramoyl-L-alanine--D-glutamate ligase [Candidatus Limnocylindria bacterium]|nr:UDP-N-acetylmuramoyl-L-alanine--D-glutamate ligase [Candidatus Limnocylindria bacterium]